MVETRSQGVLDMLGIDRDVLKARVSTKELVKLGIAYLVGAEDPKVDGRGLTLLKELQEQIVQIARVFVGEQAKDDIDIPGKLALHSENT